MSILEVGPGRRYETIDHALQMAVAGDRIEFESAHLGLRAKLSVTSVSAAWGDARSGTTKVDTTLPVPVSWDELAAPIPTWTLAVTGSPGTISVSGTIAHSGVTIRR